MAYKACAIAVEGIGVVSGSAYGPAVFGFGQLKPSHAVSIDGQPCAVIESALVQPPQLSATELDTSTGAIRSGALQVQLHARDEVTRALLAQARARRPAAALTQAASKSATTIQLSPQQPAGTVLYVEEEVIYVLTPSTGDDHIVLRGCGGTSAAAHAALASAYTQPTYWIGRSVWLLVFEMSEAGALLSTSIVWRGYIAAAPDATNATSVVQLRCEDALGVLKRARINRAPTPHQPAAPLIPYYGTRGPQVWGQISEDGTSGITTCIRKMTPWLTDGALKAMQVGQTIILTRMNVTVDGLPLLDTPVWEADEDVPGPYAELAVWSPALDAYAQAQTGKPGVAPTINCPYPYHPLTIAAALLFSSTSEQAADPLAWDVMHPQMTLSVPWLMDYDAWDQMIRRTSHLKVDGLVLGWDMREEEVWDLITRQLLPAYGFALGSSPAGRLRPIEIGLADIGRWSSAPQVAPLPGVWEWTSGVLGALDAIFATVGTTPWAPGRRIQVTGEGVRTMSAGRATRILRPETLELDWPTIAASSAEALGTTQIASQLIWRYDGLPLVSCQLPATQAWQVGDYVRLLRPDGLLTPILFDRSGARVDTLWGQAELLGQVVSSRPSVERGHYDVKLLLTNYTYGRVGTWRAPAARILSRPGTAQYAIDGTQSDFGEEISDALTLTVGDEVQLRNRALGLKASVRTITAITFTGAHYLVTLASDFSPNGAAGDWLYLAPASDYANGAVPGATGTDYPYTWMTDATTLTRPGPVITDPDQYS